MEETSTFNNRWMDKKYDTHTQNGILLSNKKNEIVPSAETWVGLEGIIPSEMLDRDKYYMIALTCRI